MCKSFCLCLSVCICVYINIINVFLCVCLCLRAHQHTWMSVFFDCSAHSIPCLCFAENLISLYLLIVTPTHNQHIRMISNNIFMTIWTIFMSVFGVCKSYSCITHLSTYTPSRFRANGGLLRSLSLSLSPSLCITCSRSSAKKGQ